MAEVRQVDCNCLFLGPEQTPLADSNTYPTEFCYDLRILLNTGSQKLLLGDRICHGVNYLAHFVLDQLFSSLVAVRRNLRFYQALRRYLAYCLAQSGYLRFLFFSQELGKVFTISYSLACN